MEVEVGERKRERKRETQGERGERKKDLLFLFGCQQKKLTYPEQIPRRARVNHPAVRASVELADRERDSQRRGRSVPSPLDSSLPPHRADAPNDALDEREPLFREQLARLEHQRAHAMFEGPLGGFDDLLLLHGVPD